MIVYESAKLHPRLLCQTYGSVMPFCMAVALPCGLMTVGLKLLPVYLEIEGGVAGLVSLGENREQILGAAFSGVNFLIGFLVVFRSQQAYNRFWEGLSSINSMQGEWWDAASSLCAFCKCSEAPIEEVILFQHTLVRLISLLNGCVLLELSTGFTRDTSAVMETKRAFELELLDAEGIDSESLFYLNSQEEKVELLFQWIQQLIVESDKKEVFSAPAPILSRAFQELSNGMVEYRQAMKIAKTPLPFPYMQATELLLISHWLCTPVLMNVWVESPLWAGLLSVIQVMFYWSLNSIATELENPFGEDANDLPAKEIQQEFNKRLLLLIRPATLRTAKLSKKAAFDETTKEGGGLRFGQSVSLGRRGVNHGHPIRVETMEDNRITWGKLQSAIEDKMEDGYRSETDEGDGGGFAATFSTGSKAPALSSRSAGRTVTPQQSEPREPRRSRLEMRHLQDYSRRLSTHTKAESEWMRSDRGGHFTQQLDAEQLHEQLAPLTNLPELLLVLTDLRDQMRVATQERKECQPETKEKEVLPPPLPSGDKAFTPRSCGNFGRPVGGEGCMVLGGCSRFRHRVDNAPSQRMVPEKLV